MHGPLPNERSAIKPVYAHYFTLYPTFYNNSLINPDVLLY